MNLYKNLKLIQGCSLAVLNKNVFNRALNLLKEFFSLIWRGKALNRDGTATKMPFHPTFYRF